MIGGCHANQLFQEVVREIRADGHRSAPRGLGVREVVNAHLALWDPRARVVSLPSRGLSLRYLVGELCFYLSGSRNLSFVAHYSKFWNRVSDDGIHVNSAYGALLFPDQFRYAINCLTRDQDSRKAVMLIYRPEHSRESRDNPCTMHLQLLIRRSQLICIVAMRSNDVWFGLSYDLPFFTLVQEIAHVLLLRQYPDLQLGPYFHNAASLHLYDKDWEDALSVLSDQESGDSCTIPELTNEDVDEWFRDLLSFERRAREDNKVAVIRPSSTPFQEWGMRILQEGMR